MIPSGSPLAAVSGVFNAVFITGDAVGDLMFYGRGAGQLPTASAVWSDILEIARRIAHDIPALALDLPSEGTAALPLRPMDGVRCSYYLRVTAQDRPGVLSRITGVLGEHGISIASMIQKGRGHRGRPGGDDDPRGDGARRPRRARRDRPPGRGGVAHHAHPRGGRPGVSTRESP